MRHTNIVVLSVVTTLLTAVGCTTTQDQGTGASNFVSGRAIDGYITQGTVFFDVNDNNIFEPLLGETFAYLDPDGYFSYNPAPSSSPTIPKDYCNSSNADDKKYCLSAPSGAASAILRVTRGYDMATREKFVGTLSVHVENFGQLDYKSANTNAMPINGLLAYKTETNSVFPANEVITSETMLKTDPFRTGNGLSDADKKTLLRMAQQIHKTADVISSLVNTHTGGFFDKEGAFPRDINHFAYAAIAKAITGSKTLDGVLTSSVDAAAIVNDTITATTDYVAKYNLDVAATAQVTLTPVSATQKTDIVTKVNKLADQTRVLFELTGAADDAYINARLRAIEVITALMRDTTAGTKYQNAIDESNRSLYLTRLGDVTADVGFTVKLFKDQAVYTAGSIESQIDFSARQGLTDLLNQNPDGSESLSLQAPNCTAPCDSFGLTLNADGTASINANLSDAGITSSGSTLPATYQKIDDYTMVMNVEVSAGVTMPVTVTVNPDGTYNYDFANKDYANQSGS